MVKAEFIYEKNDTNINTNLNVNLNLNLDPNSDENIIVKRTINLDAFHIIKVIGKGKHNSFNLFLLCFGNLISASSFVVCVCFFSFTTISGLVSH